VIRCCRGLNSVLRHAVSGYVEHAIVGRTLYTVAMPIEPNRVGGPLGVAA
jgi:hypothetical protein